MLKKSVRDKHSSLLRKCVNYGQKKFYNIGPRIELMRAQIETEKKKACFFEKATLAIQQGTFRQVKQL